MHESDWIAIESAIAARARAASASPIRATGDHNLCDHANDYCSNTVTNSFAEVTA